MLYKRYRRYNCALEVWGPEIVELHVPERIAWSTGCGPFLAGILELKDSHVLMGSFPRRFVLLRHEMPASAVRASHWDLMLESQGGLLTWEFPSLPHAPPPLGFNALGIRRLPDHRLEYLEFEGPISGNRGFVEREDYGEFTLRNSSHWPGKWIALLTGQRYLIELLLTARDLGPVAEEASGGEVIRFAPIV
jgi:hypothetical protein